MKTWLTVLALISASAASADVFENCQTAIDTNDQGIAQAQLDEMKAVKFLFDPAKQQIGVACLSLATGEAWFYDTVSAHFENVQASEAAREQRVALEKSRLMLERQMEELAAASALAKEATRQIVVTEMVEACKRLYKDAPDETLTNRVCFDVFLEIGLPE
jgi:hypothetical protein